MHKDNKKIPAPLNNSLKNVLEIIKTINYHFLFDNEIIIEPQENGRTHLIKDMSRIFIDHDGQFTDACNGNYSRV